MAPSKSSATPRGRSGITPGFGAGGGGNQPLLWLLYWLPDWSPDGCSGVGRQSLMVAHRATTSGIAW